MGRWVWKSGELLGQLVPWEVQAINTCPDNFLWEKNRAAIILSAPGLYQLSFGFYSKKTPAVQIFVNNEIVMTLVKDQNGKVDGSNSGATNMISKVGKHSAGNIVGLTLNEFVALPARARITLSFECDNVGEGFF